MSFESFIVIDKVYRFIGDMFAGMACCAKFGMDECWYRAVVVTMYDETGELMVQFIDYGNCEIITRNK